jgi:L-asparagine transporter-like permease
VTIVSNSSDPQSEGLHRQLSPRQLAMIAMGGAIGVGLFLGSSVTIQLAGPGVIVTYLLGALVAIVMAYALAEMAVVHPVAGSFGIYAETYLSAWAGFTVRATSLPSEPRSLPSPSTLVSGSRASPAGSGWSLCRWDWSP